MRDDQAPRPTGRVRASTVGLFLALVLVSLCGWPTHAQVAESTGRRFDETLDVYVRDGYVDYRVLKTSRAGLDSYVSSLASVSLDTASPQEQVAFWLNVYNAIVMQTVVNHYPIQRHSNDYPANSVRQIPGAFEADTHRLAGRTLTLDQIELTILPSFHDPRLFFALGRGAVGSGRLRSEAYSPEIGRAHV